MEIKAATPAKCSIHGCTDSSHNHSIPEEQKASNKSKKVNKLEEHIHGPGCGHNHSPTQSVDKKHETLPKTNPFLSQAKQLFTAQRLAIIASVFSTAQIIGWATHKLMGKKDTTHSEVNSSDAKYNSLDLAVHFGQLLLSCFLALSLDSLLVGRKTLKQSIGKAFAGDSLKLAFSLATFNTAMEAITDWCKGHLTNVNSSVIELLGATTRIVGNFGVARMVSGANSLTSILASACPCCGAVVCFSEVLVFCQTLFQLAQNLLTGKNQSQHSSPIQSYAGSSSSSSAEQLAASL